MEINYLNMYIVHEYETYANIFEKIVSVTINKQFVQVDVHTKTEAYITKYKRCSEITSICILFKVKDEYALVARF